MNTRLAHDDDGNLLAGSISQLQPCFSMAEQRELVLAFGAGAILASLGWCWLNDERKRKDVDAAGPPTLLRRSTVLVSDMEASLKLYRDVLELEKT